MKTELVSCAVGFNGSHMVKILKDERFWVRGVDLTFPKFCCMLCPGARVHADC